MQLCGSLSILWHCLYLGLEWKLTFSSPVATAEFPKFACIFRLLSWKKSADLGTHFYTVSKWWNWAAKPAWTLAFAVTPLWPVLLICFTFLALESHDLFCPGPILVWPLTVVTLWSYHLRFSNLKRWCCESAALYIPANLENSAVATGLEKVSFHANPKERQC